MFKLSIILLAKIRFPISNKCKPSRKRLDVNVVMLMWCDVKETWMILLSIRTNELSQHILEMSCFTLEIKALVSLLLTTIPEIKILVTLADLHFKPICFNLSRRFWTEPWLSSFSRSLTPTGNNGASIFLLFKVGCKYYRSSLDVPPGSNFNWA